MRKILFAFVLLLPVLASVPAVADGSTAPVVISEIYGGGGNTRAAYDHDFVELFNRTKQPIDLTGWIVEYSPASGTTWSAARLSGSIRAYHYFLVRFAGNGGTGAALPAPDSTGVANLARSGGKVRVRNASGVVDLVGYGQANLAEGRPTQPAPDNAQSVVRRVYGCTDTNNNAADLTVRPADPHNQAGSGHACGSPPVLNPIGNKTVTANRTLSFAISGSDADRDPLSFSASHLPIGSTFNPSTRTFTWKPGPNDTGGHSGITFTVSDGYRRDSEAITVYVTADPRAGTSQITLKVHQTDDRLTASGTVSPNRAGRSVTVKLARFSDGTYRQLGSVKVVLGDDSVYSATFDRPPPGSCKVFAKYPGDDEYNASSVEARFSC